MVVQDDGVLGLPLDVYADPVERDILGLGPKGAQYLQGIGNFLTERREMIQQDRKYGTNPVSELPVDGFCQLEALGSLAQIAGMGELLQWRTPDKFKHFEEPFTRFPYLFAIVSVMKASGLDVIESARGGPLPVVTLKPAYLISAVLLAALMCRRTGRPSAELLTSYLPAPRLAKILHQLASDGVKEVPTADDGSRPLIGLVGKYGIDP